MEQDDLERIRFVARHFDELKGLAGKVPLGLFLIGFNIGMSLDLIGAYPRAFASLAILGFAGMLWLRYRANVYYSRRIGHVERSRLPAWVYVDGPALRALAVVSAVLMLALVGSVLAVRVLRGLFCPGWGGALLVSWFRKGCPAPQGYYPVLGTVLVGLSIRSAFLPLHPHQFPISTTNDMVCGAVLVLVGLLDHWLLVRSLKPIEEFELAVAEEER